MLVDGGDLPHGCCFVTYRCTVAGDGWDTDFAAAGNRKAGPPSRAGSTVAVADMVAGVGCESSLFG